MAYQTKQVALKFDMTYHNDDTGFAYIDDVEGITCHASSIAQAANKMRKQLAEKVSNALDEQKNCQGRILGCGDGTVLIVRFKRGTWEYRICGPDSKHDGACCGFDSKDQAIDKATSHAEQVYGGVAWQHCII